MAKILILEDNEMNLDMLSRRLGRRGYDVISAKDGVKGVELAQTAGPDLILMDMSLPLMDGWKATRALKDDEATKDIPIIGLTAHAVDGDRERCLEVGCDEYESKPVHFPQLLAKISSLLGEDADH